MLNIQNHTISFNRGDFVSFDIVLKDGDTPYEFAVGDIIRITIAKNFKGTDYTLQKSFTVSEKCDKFTIVLNEDETLIGSPSSSPVVYQYDIVLNDKYSVISYNEEGPQNVIVYPRSSLEA